MSNRWVRVVGIVIIFAVVLFFLGRALVIDETLNSGSFWVVVLFGVLWLFASKANSIYSKIEATQDSKDISKYSLSDFYSWVFFACLTFLLMVAVGLNTFIYGHSVGRSFGWFDRFTIKTGDLNVWVGFFGSLFGAIIGGLITLIVMYVTTSSQRKQTNELLEEYEQQRKLSVRPYLHLYTDLYLGDDEAYHDDVMVGANLVVSNVGYGTAIDIKVHLLDANYQRTGLYDPLLAQNDRLQWISVLTMNGSAILKLAADSDDATVDTWEEIGVTVDEYLFRFEFEYRDILGTIYTSEIHQIKMQVSGNSVSCHKTLI